VTPEFSRLVSLESLGAAPREVAIEAEEAECAALAARFDLVAVHALSAKAAVCRDEAKVIAQGVLHAAVTQKCVVSGEPVAAKVETPFHIEFRPPPESGAEEVELDPAELDVVFYEGDSVDLGEAAAETLSLALDPYPRASDADEKLREAGVKSEAEAGPFAALAALREKMKPPA
jgi:uncharacterized metal-binding protein YceD (DUF177 family)